jgi:protein-L-isoaspartate(D-aspartate) O-methyltransferase
MNNTQISRSSMIQSQLLTGSIRDASLLSAMQDIPRELFVPDKYKLSAYLDEDIEISTGRYLMEPLVFARLVSLAGINSNDKVLCVACGTGYSCAVISRIADKVVGLEEIRDVAETARQNLKALSINNAEIITAPIATGSNTAPPYDVIFIEGAVQEIPDSLKKQLADNGRLVTIENYATKADSFTGLGKAVIYTKIAGDLSKRIAFDASVPLLPAFKKNQFFLL